MAIDKNDLAVINSMIAASAGPAGPAGNRINQDFGPLFSQYKITYGTALEFITDTMYDTQAYGSGGVAQLNFFQNAISLANPATTNMPLAGTLPDRQGFLVMSMRVFFGFQPFSTARTASGSLQNGLVADMVTLLTQGVLNINFLNKNYGFFPLWLLPAGGGAAPFFATEGATADPGAMVEFANNGIPDARNIYVMEQPLFLPPMTRLGVSMNWNQPAPTITRAQNIKLLFDGLMVRPIQ